MKKFTTTFFLLMAMVLLLPTELKAADVYLLCNADGAGWTTSSGLKFTPQSGDIYKVNVPVSKINQDGNQLRFRVAVDGWTGQMCPYSGNGSKVAFDMATKIANKETYVITADCFTDASGSNADSYFYFDKGTYDSYDITVSIGNTNKYIKVEGVTSGGSDDDKSLTFYVQKSNGVHIYTYDSNNGNKEYTGSWSDYPGQTIDVNTTITEVSGNDTSVTWYKVVVNGTSTLKLILNNGSGAQACDEDVLDGYYYVYDGTTTVTKSATDPTTGSGGGDDDLTGFVPGATSNGNAYYLASKDGNLFNQTLVKPSENTIKYNRILRFNDSGKGTYTVDIPATVTGDLYIEEVDKDNNVVAYYPTSSNKTISASVPANNAEVVGKLVTDLNYWAMTDRRGQNDGLYTITLTLGEDGKPGKWSFKHDAARRVAYFFSTAENSSAYPVYSDITSNKFIGYNYFDPTGVAKYYVISNITMNTDETIEKAKQLDPTLVKLPDGSPTVNKLMIMGNSGQEFRDNGTSDFTPANEHKANEMSPDSEPMIAGSNLQGLCKVEYNPSNGDNKGAVYGNRYGMRGQIQVRQGGSAESIMTIVGPLVENSVSGGTWDWTYAVDDENVMKYNDVENCYEITITTKKDQEGKEFRFVQDKIATKSWGETGEIARIPYYDETKPGHAATVADPNDVEIKAPGTYNIRFNRPAGKWTIKFYFVNHADETTSYYYTINGEDNFTVIIPEVPAKDGKRYVLRTFSYGADMTPTDAGVHIYVAHSFSATPEDSKKLSTGQVKLYEINYVPANTGVVLFCKDKTGEQHVNFVPSNAYNTKNYPIVEMKDRWTYDHSGETYHNDLQPVLVKDTFGPSVFAEDGKTITKRNFGLGLFSKTTIFTGVDADDYIGFFRLINWVGDNKAFLQYGTDVIANNAQAFGQTTDQVQLEGATMNSKLALVFEGFNDFDDSETTGIKDTITEVGNNGDNSYYNLQGIKVATPVKGIYIHNGKKVVIK